MQGLLTVADFTLPEMYVLKLGIYGMTFHQTFDLFQDLFRCWACFRLSHAVEGDSENIYSTSNYIQGLTPSETIAWESVDGQLFMSKTSDGNYIFKDLHTLLAQIGTVV